MKDVPPRSPPAGSARLSRDVLPVVGVSLVPPLLVAVAAAAALYVCRSRHSPKPDAPARPDWAPKQTADLYLASDPPCGGGGGCAGSLPGPGPGSGPGAGQAQELLPIQLEVLVGKGRFAEVWAGRLRQGEAVAVKVFPALEVASWRNECSIVSDPNMLHDNIVRFRAAEERGPPGHAPRQLWLVLAYHGLGNLQDFLRANILGWEELVAMAASVAKGLAHLHSDTTQDGVPKVAGAPVPPPPPRERPHHSSLLPVAAGARCPPGPEEQQHRDEEPERVRPVRLRPGAAAGRVPHRG